MEVLPPDDGAVVVKVSLQASGTIQGVAHTSIWTYIIDNPCRWIYV